METGYDALVGLFDLSLLRRLGLEDWLESTLGRCAEWFRASGATVFLEDSPGVFRLRCGVGRLDAVKKGTAIRNGEGIAGLVLQDGSPHIVEDPRHDPLFGHKIVSRRADVASSMIVPLIGPSGRRVGVMNLSRATGEPAFEDRDLKEAALVGAQVALAVENAEAMSKLEVSFREQQARAEQLKAVLDSVAGTVVVYQGPLGESELETFPNFVRDESERLVLEAEKTQERAEGKAHDSATDRTWLLVAVPLSQGGGVLTVQEVTQYQRAQDEAARMRRMAEIGQMSATIAHELRNPLTGIRGAAQLILADPSLAPEFAKMVNDEADKMSRLCDDFLDIAKPLRLMPKPCRLSESVERVVRIWRPKFLESGVTLVWTSRGQDPTIKVDVARVEQILHNLIKNALEASSLGGKVEVSAEGGRITVTDHGMGMDEQTRERLFAPFFTTKASGTGLGLCNVRRIVNAHGGTVTVTSELGKGSTFEINLRQDAA